MELKPMNIIGGITIVLSLVGGVIAFDSRYAKHEEFILTLSQLKIDIINEMRTEVVKNRTVMIQAMQREADDLDYQIKQMEKAGEPVPRYLSEKHTQIERQIEALKNDKTSDTD